MYLEAIGLAEGSLTLLALEGFIPSVYSFMYLEVTCLGECSITLSALIWSLSSVSSFMLFKQTKASKSSITLSAVVRLLLNASQLLFIGLTRKHYAVVINISGLGLKLSVFLGIDIQVIWLNGSVLSIS